MLSDTEYRGRIALALAGLVPIAWMERLSLCANKLKPTREELFPSPTEREAIVERLVMADTLAAGGAVGKKGSEKRGSDLAALAKAIAILACAPGGVTFLGTWYRAVDDSNFGLILESSPTPKNLPAGTIRIPTAREEGADFS